MRNRKTLYRLVNNTKGPKTSEEVDQILKDIVDVLNVSQKHCDEHVEKCLTCGKLLVAYERYLQCSKKEITIGPEGQHGPVITLRNNSDENKPY
jgi:hypothetical protein